MLLLQRTDSASLSVSVWVYHRLTRDALQKKDNMLSSPLPVKVIGRLLAVLLMLFVTICNTQLSLESYKQQPEHSREQQGHELISQPSGAGK